MTTRRQRKKTQSATAKTPGKKSRVGVFVCHCGSNIASVIDVKALEEYAKTLPNVVYAVGMNYPCSHQGQDDIIASIKKNKLNRVVVAGCSPRLYEPTFQRCVSQAGLSPWLFEMANIREFSSWCHSNKPEEATIKAMDTLRMAVAKASLLEPLQPIDLPITKSAMIIGGGIAGISAALDLADMGYKVYTTVSPLTDTEYPNWSPLVPSEAVSLAVKAAVLDQPPPGLTNK